MNACEDRQNDDNLCDWPYTKESSCTETYAESVKDSFYSFSTIIGILMYLTFLVLGMRCICILID